MLIVNCQMEIANNLMERQPLSPSLLPCCAYLGNVHDYIASQVPPHWHPELELFILDQGEAEVSLADDTFLLKPGYGYFVNANKLHSLRALNEGPCEYRCVVFDSSIIAGAVGSPFDVQYIRPLLEHGPSALLLQPDMSWQRPIYKAFEEAYASCAAELAGYEFAVRHALSQIIFTLHQFCNEQSQVPRTASLREKRLKQMVEWIDCHFAEPVQLQMLAEAVNLSSRECERTFKQLLHITPMTYLLRRRIAAASELLVNTDLPILEIGFQCGFSSHSYFSKQFHSLTGYTPREFRANIGK